MRKIKLLSINLFMMIFVSAVFFSSCNYTKNTSTAKSFSKKHYNRGFVKIRNNSSEKSQESVRYAENISKKEVIANIEHIAETKEISASTEFNHELNSNYVTEFVINNLASTKENILAEKSKATTVAEIKKADKALEKLNKVESMIVKRAPKIAERAEFASASAIPPSSRSAAERKGLSALVLGAVGLFFGFLAVNIAAVILGKKAMNMSTAGTQAYEQGRIGRILGWVGIAIAIFFFLLLILLVASAI